MNINERINFQEHNGKFGRQLGIHMPGGFWVPKSDVDLAWQNASVRYRQINWHGKVCSATFFDPVDWKRFPFGKQLALGRCIKYFSANHLLPIEVANPGKKGRRLYRKCT